MDSAVGRLDVHLIARQVLPANSTLTPPLSVFPRTSPPSRLRVTPPLWSQTRCLLRPRRFRCRHCGLQRKPGASRHEDFIAYRPAAIIQFSRSIGTNRTRSGLNVNLCCERLRFLRRGRVCLYASTNEDIGSIRTRYADAAIGPASTFSRPVSAQGKFAYFAMARPVSVTPVLVFGARSLRAGSAQRSQLRT